MAELFAPQFDIEAPADKVEELGSALDLSTEKKADVLLSLLGIFHSNINSWTTQVYQVVIWATAISFAAASYVFLNAKAAQSSRVLLAVGLGIWGVMIQLFLARARRAYYGNRLGIAKCEAALGLYQSGSYLKERLFFVYSKQMLHSRNLQFVIVFHLAVTLTLMCFVLLGGFLV